MAYRIDEQGEYELFETEHGNRILVLDGSRWYAWVQGQRGEILVLTDDEHGRRRTCGQGRFYLVSFQDDPQYRDQPHLFLQTGDRYDELILPNGLPTEEDSRKRIVPSGEPVPRGDLEAYLEESGAERAA